MTRPPTMSPQVWRSLLRLPLELVARVLRGDDTRPPQPRLDDDEDDVLAPLRRWRIG